MTTPEIVIGIDNGLSGGLVALDQHCSIVDMIRMPVKKCPWRGNIISTEVLYTWLRSFLGIRFVVLEECPDHANQASTMRSMAFSFGQICTAVELAGLADRLRFVRSGNPMDSWQRITFHGWNATISGETKRFAAREAARVWPSVSFVPHKCRTPDTGLLDAALIARHAIVNCMGGRSLPLSKPEPKTAKKRQRTKLFP